jgi:hypothetical protein
VEYLIGHERIEFTLGDLLEFSIGYTVIGLLCEFIGW